MKQIQKYAMVLVLVLVVGMSQGDLCSDYPKPVYCAPETKYALVAVDQAYVKGYDPYSPGYEWQITGEYVNAQLYYIPGVEY